jgi:hypothetical protein
MAKQRRQNSAVSAIAGLINTIGNVAEIELAGNPEAIADVKQMTANLVDSNLTTAMEHLDDSIETKHQVDAILEEGGLDPVQLGRDGAIAGANIAVEIEQAKLAEQPELDEQVDEQVEAVIGTAPEPTE